jgi:hypothetical protein
MRFVGFGLGLALAAASLVDCGGSGKSTTTGNGGATGSAGIGSTGSAGATASGAGGTTTSGAGGSTASGAGGSTASGAGGASSGAGGASAGAGGATSAGTAGATMTGVGGMTGAAGSIVTGQAGKPGIVMCTPGVQAALITDCGYPTTTGSSLSKVLFNENEVLAAIQPAGGAPQGIVRLFYNDEHAMTLGVHRVVVKTGPMTMTAMDYPVSPLLKIPDSVMNAQLGTTALMGDQSGLDQSLRPMWPVLYITDITSDPNSRVGDWQQGGVPTGPTDVFGTWKGAIRTVDKSVTPNTVVITPDMDPMKNMWNLGPGADPVPAALTKSDGYGAEVRWTVSIAQGHSYRVQVIVHDGDQNKGGGDCGEACVLFCAGGSNTTGAGGAGGTGGAGGSPPLPPPPPPPPICPPGVQACGPGGIEPTSCPVGTVCANGCCLTDIIVP